MSARWSRIAAHEDAAAQLISATQAIDPRYGVLKPFIGVGRDVEKFVDVLILNTLHFNKWIVDGFE